MAGTNEASYLKAALVFERRTGESKDVFNVHRSLFSDPLPHTAIVFKLPIYDNSLLYITNQTCFSFWCAIQRFSESPLPPSKGRPCAKFLETALL